MDEKVMLIQKFMDSVSVLARRVEHQAAVILEQTAKMADQVISPKRTSLLKGLTGEEVTVIAVESALSASQGCVPRSA
ncbi:MAG: hypothetical protein JSR33_04355 [Proteobacteria bacterium]|nr:hypothetical protein [Pseudomonadota bacterium]